MILSSIIKRRIEALESKQSPEAGQIKRLIATALQVTDAEPHITEAGGVVTFLNKSLAAAYAMREAWLSEQPAGVIAMVCPRDSGDKVLKVLAERHADD